MNHSVYILGDFGDGYIQYPDDYAKSIFRSVLNNDTKTQIAIQRDGNILYYIYTRIISLTNDHAQYIGICIAFNGVCCNSIKLLFSLFEELFTHIVVSGKLLEFNDNGDVVCKSTQLYRETIEIEKICQRLNIEIDNLPSSAFMELPPLNYATGKGESIFLKENSSKTEFTHAIKNFNSIFVNKNKDINTQALTGYSAKLHNLNSVNKDLVTQNFKLTAELNKVKKQKKRTKIVTILIILIMALGIIFMYVSSNMSDQIMTLKSSVRSLEEEVKKDEHIIQTLSSDNDLLTNKNKSLEVNLNRTKDSLSISKERVSFLTNNVAELKGNVESQRSEVSRLNSAISTIKSSCPLVITKVEIANKYPGGKIETNYGGYIYSASTMYLWTKVYYFGLDSGYKNLNVKLFKPNGSLSTGEKSPDGYSFSSGISINFGQGSNELLGWGGETKGNWGSGTYRIEIWYNDVCLKSQSFHIY